MQKKARFQGGGLAAVLICLSAMNLADAASVDPQQADDLGTEADNSAWDAAAESSAEAWNMTKDASSDVWDAVKESSTEVWEASKAFTIDAWESTREWLDGTNADLNEDTDVGI